MPPDPAWTQMVAALLPEHAYSGGRAQGRKQRKKQLKSRGTDITSQIKQIQKGRETKLIIYFEYFENTL